MTDYKLIYQLHVVWIGGRECCAFDSFPEALYRAAELRKYHSGCLGLIEVFLWRACSDPVYLSFCPLYHLSEWSSDLIQDAVKNIG